MRVLFTHACKNVHADINTYSSVNSNLRMTIVYLSDQKCRRKPRRSQWNNWNRRTPAGFTALAYCFFKRQREIVMKLNTRGYRRLATDFLDCVHTNRNVPCTRRNTGQDTKRKLRYTCIDTCKHSPNLWALLLCSSSLTAFLSFLLSSTQRHFGWEVDPLLLMLGTNNPDNGGIRLLSVCPQNSNALS